MGLQIEKLSKSDIGAWVVYKSYQNEQKGRIKSFNEKWVFVVYSCDENWSNYKNYTAEATDPRDLIYATADLEPEEQEKE